MLVFNGLGQQRIEESLQRESYIGLAMFSRRVKLIEIAGRKMFAFLVISIT